MLTITVKVDNEKKLKVSFLKVGIGDPRPVLEGAVFELESGNYELIETPVNA